MKWDRSANHDDNVEDRRGQRASGAGLRLPGGKLSLGGIVMLLIAAYLGKDSLLGGGASGGAGGVSVGGTGAGGGATLVDDDPELTGFIKASFQDVQGFWQEKLGRDYRRATLVLFSDTTDTACGLGEKAIGPFYCPGDERVYIDLSFYAALDKGLGAPGDFAQAYVIAHEIGHHLQHLRGDDERVQRLSAERPDRKNALSVRLELQADCFAGIWGRSAQERQKLEIGDLEEGLRAAAAIGDDTLQRRGGGRVAPESWTHGSSAQRVTWFKRGFEKGTVDACDTFNLPD
jgi:hypothetical protein